MTKPQQIKPCAKKKKTVTKRQNRKGVKPKCMEKITKTFSSLGTL